MLYFESFEDMEYYLKQEVGATYLEKIDRWFRPAPFLKPKPEINPQFDWEDIEKIPGNFYVPRIFEKWPR